MFGKEYILKLKKIYLLAAFAKWIFIAEYSPLIMITTSDIKHLSPKIIMVLAHHWCLQTNILKTKRSFLSTCICICWCCAVEWSFNCTSSNGSNLSLIVTQSRHQYPMLYLTTGIIEVRGLSNNCEQKYHSGLLQLHFKLVTWWEVMLSTAHYLQTLEIIQV